MLTLPRTIYRNKFALPDLPPPSTFDGQTILITGATSGLGLATAVHLLNLGAASVIITARTTTKGAAAVAEIERQTHTAGQGKVKVLELDLSTFAGVVAFVEEVTREVGRIDYVLLNAGVLNAGKRVSDDGWEQTLQVNVLSTALLAILLLPWMKEKGRGKAHLGLVGSGLHRGVEITAEKGWPQEGILEFWNRRENWEKKGGQGMYALSKLLVQYVIREIARLAEGRDGKPEVIVNSMCPGMVKTELGRDYTNGIVMSLAADVFLGVIMKTVEGGARTPVRAALTKPEENGLYYTDYQSDEDYKRATQKNVFGPAGQKMQAQVWKEVVAILQEKVPEIQKIVGTVAR